MPKPPQSDIETFTAEALAQRKYATLCPATVRSVAAVEAGRHKSHKAFRKAARARLHRVLASYLGELDYDADYRALESAMANGGDGAVEAVCRTLLAKHSSARERLAILDQLYAGIFAVTGRPDTLLDLACAAHPLGFRFMGLPRSAAYHAYDINRAMVEFLGHYFALEGLDRAKAHWRDVLCDPPAETGDLALLLKMYHCLERRERGAGLRVVEAAKARWLAVSFPTRTLAARAVAIAANYEDSILAAVRAHGWRVERLEFATELIFLIDKGAA